MKQKTEYSAVSGSTAEGSSRHSFSGQLGYILAAAGASVGLGNIWRFPYLAARYGGGIFLLIYIALAVTFGYTMIVAETVIGRRKGKAPSEHSALIPTTGSSMPAAGSMPSFRC